VNSASARLLKEVINITKDETFRRFFDDDQQDDRGDE
jgi:hypothetical protein